MAEFAGQILGVVKNPLFQSIAWAVALGAVTLLVAKIAAHAVSRLLHHDSNPLPTSSIIINIVRAIILIIGASIILDACFDVNTSSLIAALGVGGIAVSLGFQDTLSNLIGGLQVTFMGIVKPGDNIEVGSEIGVVQDVTWRHTTIRDALGQTVIIPNSIISTTALVHLLPANRVTVPFTVPRYHTAVSALGVAGAHEGDPVDVDALSAKIVEDARAAAGGVSPVIDGPSVFFSEVGDLGVKGNVVLQVQDAASTARAADAVVRAISRELS